jgi:hypothetical protein
MHIAAKHAIQLTAGELALVDGALHAGAAEGTTLVFDEVQMEGKPRLPGGVFARDFQLKPGERLV